MLGGKEVNLDSLNAILDSAKEDSEKIQLLIQFSISYRDHDHYLGMTFARQALLLAEEKNDIRGKIQSHMAMAEIYVNYLQDYENGLSHLTKSRELNQIDLNPKQEVIILRLMGFVHRRMDNIQIAQKCYEDAIKISKENNFEDYVGLLAYVADMLVNDGQKEAGIEYYERVLELEDGNSGGESRPEVKVSLAQYYLLVDKPEPALDIYKKAVSKFEEEENFRWASYVWSEIAAVNLLLGRNNDALETGQRGLEMAEKYNLVKELSDNHATMSIIYDSIGDFEKSLYHFRLWAEITDEMISVRKAREISSIQSAHEFALQEQELLRLKKEKELELARSRIVSASTGMGVLLVGLVSLFLYRGYRQKQKVNSELEDRVELKDLALSDIVKQLKQEVKLHEYTQAQLANSHSDFNHFVHQTSHDLRGPLSSILGLVSIAEQEIPSDERLRYLEMIGSSTQRLRKKLDSLIQAIHLSESEVNLQKIDLRSVVDGLLAQLSAKELMEGVEMEVHIEPEVSLSTDRHLLKVILGNLLDNAFRYRISKDHAHRVILYAQQENQDFVFRIQDSGRGIPEEKQNSVFEMFVKSQQDFDGSGLGLFLVKKAVAKLRGTMSLDSQEGEGTAIEVRLPQ